ncbi:hypothetical protein NQ315_001520 [Exocentrus adspersus]|uniref:Uncharacterized protein n=1 Tax=Exocentrus adspersus TaxID=1586481 RepID=A0AAV8W8V6_9CUCU|nr:hypothetical protein NQ315_001520 [Exocentrus adspersus]
MSSRSLLLVLLASFVYIGDASDMLKAMLESDQIIQKFLNLVEANQMNVSVVTSTAQLWSNGQVQMLKDNALLMPPNDVILTESKLTQQVGKQWLSDVQSWTAKNKGVATFRVVNVQNGKVQEQVVESSNVEAIPMSPSLETILLPVQTGEQGLLDELDTYEIMYNFQVPTSGGQSKSVAVLAAQMNLTIVDNSEHMPLTEINKMKEILAKVWMMIDDLELGAEVLAEAINDKMPLRKSEWQVMVGPESFYIPSGSKWVRINVSDVSVVIFALAQ